MFSLTVRDHFMIAHSFEGEIFGPARRMHGATYVVDASFMREALDDDDLVVDIGLAGQTVNRVLAAMNMRNLDDAEEFRGRNTTTEFLAWAIFDRLRHAIEAGELGAGAKHLKALRVTLAESHVAWASFESDL